MGIKNLNRFLMNNCSRESIKKKHLKTMKQKTLVIDTSIYLYKFISENALITRMHQMIMIFKKYEIIPIFIFDGKPPPEKMDLLQERKLRKKEAESKYNEIKNNMEIMENDEDYEENKNRKENMLLKMNSLKKQFIRINNGQIKEVKELMDAFGVIYYDAPSEADELCAHFMQSGKAWGCITNDMDMFIYDSTFILRNLNINNHTIMVYDKKKILEELKMTEKCFREIMILSGTDYNIHSRTNLNDTINWYNEYQKYVEVFSDNNTDKNSKKPLEFYIWILRNSNYIQDYMKLLKTYKLFMIDSINIELNKTEKPINTIVLDQIIKNDSFIK